MFTVIASTPSPDILIDHKLRMIALPFVQFIYGYGFQYLAPSSKPVKEHQPFSILPLSISQSISDLMEDVQSVIDSDVKANGGYFFVPPYIEFETFNVVATSILSTPSNVSSDNDLSIFATISDSSRPESPSSTNSCFLRRKCALENKKLAFTIFKYL